VPVVLRIDASERRPIYEQIADGIRGLIANGQLREGATLPPVRQLAKDLGVNLNTVAAAYRELQSDGLIALKHGSGTKVASVTAAGRPASELRAPLRTALTQLVLAGMRREDILRAVREELQDLTAGAAK
jgi:GntR family transcriptional regulator